MSELIEINKDNCVLSEFDMENLEQTFDVYKNQAINNKYEKQITNMLDKLFLKINKLNDLAIKEVMVSDDENFK